ncbi:MAG: dephospho-CoA kinase [Leptolyngbya sp. SIO1D8]|nr:dephospho-CoA kinase [Leptolyngbya sp. SIO1D8]
MGQRIIGLTGGIATGKTTVSRYLETHHRIPILDADVFARQAVEVGSAILSAIAQRYGTPVLNADGTLHRRQLGQIIFNDPQEKQWVEQQIHPVVRQRFAQEMAALTQVPIVVQAIPLLFEAHLTNQVTEIWVVVCPEVLQLERLMSRDSLSEAAAQARIHNQWSLEEKAKRADVVLENRSTLEALYQQVDQALEP